MGVVQRTPLGLLDLLNMKGVENLPDALARELRPTLELLQFYGLSQRQVVSNANAALTEGTVLGIVLPAAWCVLFFAELQITKTGTLTALRGSISLQRGIGSSVAIAAEELGPFGATETGTARMAAVPPYPLLLPPNSLLISRADIIGTDANVAATIAAEIGVLG